MPAFIQQFVNALAAIWAKMSPLQRIASVGGAVGLLAAVIGMSIWLSRPEYKVLYSNLGPEDASVVIKTLQGDKVAYVPVKGPCPPR